MTFYKSDPKFKLAYDDLIEKAYLEGKYLTKDKYGCHVKKSLPKGMNKYNKELFVRAKDLERDYKYLITIESAFIGLIQNYCTDSNFMTRNIWNIMQSQKGTYMYLWSMKSALKKYTIAYTKLYDAIVRNFDSMDERRDRNKEFLDVWSESCGLTKLTSAIKEDFGCGLFEYTQKVLESDDAPNFIGKDKKEYYEERDAYYLQQLINFATENNIDLTQEINDAHERAIKEQKEIAADKSDRKRYNRMARKQKLADIKMDDDNIRLFHVIESGNHLEPKLSNISYSRILENLKRCNGSAYYINILKSSRVMYLTEDNTTTLSFKNVAWFATEDEAKPVIDKWLKHNPEDIVKALKLSLPETAALPVDPEIKKRNSIQQALVDQQKMILNLMSESAFDFHKTSMLELLFMQTPTIYWITALRDKYASLDTQESRFISADKYDLPVCNSLTQAAIFISKTQAIAKLKELQSNEKLANWNLYLNSVSYTGEKILHDKALPKQLDIKAEKLAKDLSMWFQHKDEMPKELINETAGNAFKKQLIKYGCVRLIVAQSPNFASNLQFIQGQRHIYKIDMNNHMMHNVLNRSHGDWNTVYKNLFKSTNMSYAMIAKNASRSECQNLHKVFLHLKKNQTYQFMYGVIQLTYDEHTETVTGKLIEA